MSELIDLLIQDYIKIASRYLYFHNLLILHYLTSMMVIIPHFNTLF